MSKLERWLPFKFKRKAEAKSDQEHTEHTRYERAQALVPQFPLQHLMQSVFSDPFFRDPFSRFSGMERWFGDFSPKHFVPNVEIVDEEDALRLTAELPGMQKEDVHLSVDRGSLVITGEKKNQHESRENGVYRTERYYGHFHRSIPLPDDVAQDKVEATFDNGVLNVTLPKAANARDDSRVVTIR